MSAIWRTKSIKTLPRLKLRARFDDWKFVLYFFPPFLFSSYLLFASTYR